MLLVPPEDLGLFKYSNIDQRGKIVKEKKTPPSGKTFELMCMNLANYNDEFLFMTGGFYTLLDRKYVDDVNMYDIKNDSWSACPKRLQKGG